MTYIGGVIKLFYTLHRYHNICGLVLEGQMSHFDEIEIICPMPLKLVCVTSVKITNVSYAV